MSVRRLFPAPSRRDDGSSQTLPRRAASGKRLRDWMRPRGMRRGMRNGRLPSRAGPGGDRRSKSVPASPDRPPGTGVTRDGKREVGASGSSAGKHGAGNIKKQNLLIDRVSEPLCKVLLPWGEFLFVQLPFK